MARFHSSTDIEDHHQAIADAIVRSIHTGPPQYQHHADATMISKVMAVAKRVIAPEKSLPFWLKMDGAITREHTIIKTAFEDERSISEDELKTIMDIRKERNDFVFNRFFHNRDPRKDDFSMKLPHDSGGGLGSLDLVKKEIARRKQYRNEHPAVPESQGELSPGERAANIRFENEDLQKSIAYWAKTSYSGIGKEYNTMYIEYRRRMATGMEMWNALLLHDTLTESCFERADGTRRMSSIEQGKLQENVDDLKFLVRILTMNQY